jgi:hypothetical protein
MEQSRAPTILIHQFKLARNAPCGLRNSREFDFLNDHDQGINRRMQIGQKEVSDRKGNISQGMGVDKN